MSYQIGTKKISNQITLYQRSDHNEKYWQARLRIKDEYGKNRYLLKSTGLKDFEEAEKEAYRLLIKSESLIDAGKSVFGITFKRTWDEYIEDQKYLADIGSISASRYKSKVNMTRRWVARYFTNHRISRVTDDDMRNFWKWRINFAESEEAKIALKENGAKYFAKTPKPVTLHEESMVISQIFRFGVSKGYLRTEEIPNIKPPVNWETHRRHPFDEKEMKNIYAAVAAKITDSKGKQAKNAWTRLRYRILTMVNSGMRPTEANNLKWGDYKHWFKPEDNRTYTVAFVHGKGKQRELTTVRSVGKWLDEYREVVEFTDDDDYVFHMANRTQATRDNDLFGKLLAECGLLKDKKGENRTLYSLRHTYATKRILDGNVDWELLSMNMGTSTKMLRDHYAHVIPQQKAAELTFSSKYELRQQEAERKQKQKDIEDAENVTILATK